MNPDCQGNTLTGKIACAPTDESMYAWNDFVAFLTSRWSGANGRFTHFIIWNEVWRLADVTARSRPLPLLQQDQPLRRI